MPVKNMQAPCKACPFKATTAPGALGGSPAEKYVGQSIGPFILPCHKACDFSDPSWKAKTMDTPQCAGAAIYRANIGVSDFMPSQIHRLPPGTHGVFKNHVEFVAHHKGIDPEEARQQLLATPPARLLNRELAQMQNIWSSGGKTP